MRKHAQKTKFDVAYQKAFGRKVKEVREKRAWTQGDLAVISSVSEAQISAIENGRESPRLHTIKSIAVALGVTPSSLVDFDFDLKLNTNFRRGKVRKSGTTKLIRSLFDDGFFSEPRSVSDVIQQCRSKFNVDLISTEVSGVMLLLVGKSQLTKVTQGANRNIYMQKIN